MKLGITRSNVQVVNEMSGNLGTCNEFRFQKLEPTESLDDDAFGLHSHSLTLVGNRLYVLGGMFGTTQFSKKVLSFNYYTKTWKVEIDELPESYVFRMMETFLHGDALWSIGEKHLRKDTVWRFDLVTKDLTVVETTGDYYLLQEVLPMWSCFAEGISKLIVAVYPRPNARTAVQDFYALNVDTKVWRKVPSKGKRPEPGTGYEQVACHNHHLYALSKTRDKGFTLFILDVKQEPWIWSTPDFYGVLPSARNRASIAYAGGRIFVFGGVKFGEVGLVSFDELDIAHLSESRWDNSKAPEQTGLQHTVVLHGDVPKLYGHSLAVATDRIFIIGGIDCSTNTVYEISANLQE